MASILDGIMFHFILFPWLLLTPTSSLSSFHLFVDGYCSTCCLLPRGTAAVVIGNVDLHSGWFAAVMLIKMTSGYLSYPSDSIPSVYSIFHHKSTRSSSRTWKGYAAMPRTVLRLIRYHVRLKTVMRRCLDHLLCMLVDICSLVWHQGKNGVMESIVTIYLDMEISYP